GCTYREGLNAVAIQGGVAGNVIPDECAVEVNFRFAPDRSAADAEAHVREVFAGYTVDVTDSAPGALPGLSSPAAATFLSAMDVPVRAKYGWTDVSRFSGLGVPAVNFGPGEPNLAHTVDEHVEIGKITAAAEALRRYLATPPQPPA
ncbi:MAG TPA: M20/M25/M40 family metallo-hydrolase, partial [Cryptosporangiaceae bacterium]|nr:M20/M25/M40 family metallo-hydrolase [Cryptosporangiaceae bacterium]